MTGVEIDRLTLRLSGVTPERARAIALGIARGVAAAPRPPATSEPATVGVSTRAVPGETDGDTAERIARQILRELGGA